MTYEGRTIALAAILGFAMLLPGMTTTHNAYADTENITLRSDSSHTMLVGPAGSPFPNAFTAADFAAASSGPNAFEIPNHNAWVPHLSVDPAGKYIGTANVNPNHFGPNFQLVTALYAVDFEITSDSIDSATLDFHFLVDNNLGWLASQGFGGADNEGIFINGQPVVGTTLPINVCGFCSEHSFTGLDISGLVNPGTNTLYVYASDYGQPSGLQYRVDINIESTPPDTTPPVVTGTTDRAPDSNGWYNQPVTVTWTGTDDGGIASCDAPTVYAGPDGNSVLLTGHCTDNAGNTGEGTVTINYDATAPTITGAPTTAPNANNWYNADVTVHFTASDGTSGIAAVTPDTTLTTEAAGQSVTGTATDNAGNSASFTVSGINIDKTAPEAYNQFDPATKNVLVFGRDGLSGVQPGAIAPSSVTQVKWGGDDDDDDEDDDDNGKAELHTYTVVDKAGNTLILVEKVKKEGKEIKIEMVSLQYNGGAVIDLQDNKKSFQWSTNKNGSIKELEQKMTIGKGKDKQTVDAKFEAKKAQTTVKEVHGGDDDDDGKKAKLPGLVLLRMATNNGSLMIEY